MTARRAAARHRGAAGPALAALGSLALAAGAPAPALGGFFPGRPVDGPGSQAVAVGDVDLGRDGGGGIAYVRREGGEEHAFLSLLREGIPQPGARVDVGHGPLVAGPVLAAGEGGRLAVLWADALGVWARVRPAGGSLGPARRLGGPGATSPVADMTVSGVAYAAWSESGDVRAAYLPRLASAFVVYPAPLDADPALPAGAGAALRPRLRVAADGVGLAAWGELDERGASRIRARRLVKERLSTVALDATPAALGGAPAGPADLPEIAIEDDSSFAWVVFRQALADGSGRARAIARRLRGSLFESPVAFDGAPAAGAVGPPRVAANGRGWGVATVEAPGGAVLAAPLRDGGLAATQAAGSGAGAAPSPVAAYAQSYDGVVAWLQADGPGAPATLRARPLADSPAALAAPALGASVLLSDAAAGGIDPHAGHAAAADGGGDLVIAYVEGAAPDRRLAVAGFDRPPSSPVAFATRGWRRSARPALRWRAALDPWGGLTYRVLVDGQPAVETGALGARPAVTLADGAHRWQVVAIDRRGQQAASRARSLRVDATAPALGLRVLGARRAGARLRLVVSARDGGGSGVTKVRVSFGDHTPARLVAAGAPAAHSYRRAGRYRVAVIARDRVGHAARIVRVIAVRGK